MKHFGVCVFVLVVVPGFLAAISYKSGYSVCRVAIKNGQVRQRGRGRLVKFSCNVGYILAGEKIGICVRGKLDTTVPKCVRATCSNVAPPTNGLIYASYRGAVNTFFCKPGFQLRGSNITYCDGKSWDSNLPTCLANGTEPQHECDFESETLCGWTHDLNHDFDWRRMQFKTPSGHIGTGPSFDHTKGVGENGYYMYIESSSRFENDTARLISPVYDATENETCFEFYYHMYGATTGSLRAYVKKFNDTWELRPETAFFAKSGNQGNHWFRSFTALGAIEQDFQIVIEGVRGKSYVSDIAIDDLKLIENCNPVEETTQVDTTYVTDSPELTVESCENRCGTSDTGNTTDNNIIRCDCDGNCIDKNTCCPDYIAVCVQIDYSSDFTTTEVVTETAATTALVVRKTNASTAKVAPSTIRLTFLTPPTVFPRKTYATKPKPSSVTSTTTTTTTTTTSTTTTKPNIPTVKFVDDEATVMAIEMEATSLPVVPQTAAPERPVVHLVSKIYREEPATGATTFIVIGCVLLLSAVVIAGVVVKKCGVAKCARLKRMQSSRGSDSQSDVRFLTSDEILNFNLATDGCM